MKAITGIVFVLVTFLPAAARSQAAESRANRVFLFASPNTRESLTDGEAEGGLTSLEQLNAVAVADLASCALTHVVQIGGSLGVYDSSAENAFIVAADLEQKPSEYLASLLGLYSHQKFVLLFFPGTSGSDRLWVIKTPQSLEMVMLALRKMKLTPATLRVTRDQNEIWFVDDGEKVTDRLKALTAAVNGRAIVTAGFSESLGNEDRSEAAAEWKQRIEAFEKVPGRHLSSQLFSPLWRGASAAHTCSREIFGRQ